MLTLNTIESGHLWGVLAPFIIPLGLTFLLALVLFFIISLIPPGKSQRAFSIATLILIPASLFLFLYISLSSN